MKKNNKNGTNKFKVPFSKLTYENLLNYEFFPNGILDAIQDGISILDDKLNVIKVNYWLNKMYPEDLPIEGKKCYKVYHGKKSICSWCPSTIALKTGKRKTNIVPYTKDKNTVGWQELSAYPIINKSNKTIGVIEYVKDITGRKQAEELLKVQYDLTKKVCGIQGLDKILDKILESMLNIEGIDSGGIYIRDFDNKLLKLMVYKGLNKKFIKEVKILGENTPQYKLVSKGKSIYKSYADLIPDKNKNKIREGLRAIGVIPIIHNNKVIGCLNVASHIFDEINSQAKIAIETISTLVGGVISRVIAENALRENEFKLRTFLDSMSDVAIEMDLDGNIIYCNKAGEDLLDKPLKDIINTSFLSFFHESNHQKLLRIFQRSLRGINNDFEMPLINGKICHFKDEFKRDKNGKIIGIIGIARDITNKKNYQREMEKINKKLEERVDFRTNELNATIDELQAFSFSVSHDLQAPLRHIKGYCDAILEDNVKQLDGMGKTMFNRILVSVDLMQNLIQDLLKLSHVNQDTMEIEYVNLTKICLELEYKYSLENSTREIEWKIKPSMKAKGDRKLITILLTNLIDNAYKFTSKNKVSKIEFGSVKEDKNVFFYIRDNGVGFDMDYSDKLFTPFQRLHSKEDFDGSGIGLATVQRVIRRHGGTIWVDSMIGKGTTFYFNFTSK